MNANLKQPSEMVVNWSGRGHKYTEEEIETVTKVMREADPLTQGRYQKEFECDFAGYTGSNHAFAVTSCTAALELSAILCDLKPGDEVVSPSHTFAASVIPFARTGAKLVWADIDPETFVVTRETLEACITPQTKVLIVVHLYGLACDMDPIMDLARERNLLVVEDAAQCPGGTYKGRKLGSIGDFGCFSFHTHKNMTTLGEGGALLVKDDAKAELVPGLRHNGMRGFTGERDRYWIPAMSNVDFDIDGFWPYNFCLGEVQCALGSQMLKRLDQMNAERAAKAKVFHAGLADISDLTFQKKPEGCGHTYHLMPARYDGPVADGRNKLIASLFGEHGIKAVVQYYPLNRYPMFEKAGFGEADCPETDRLFDNMISFPFHHWQTEAEVEYMIEHTKQAVAALS